MNCISLLLITQIRFSQLPKALCTQKLGLHLKDEKSTKNFLLAQCPKGIQYCPMQNNFFNVFQYFTNCAKYIALTIILNVSDDCSSYIELSLDFRVCCKCVECEHVWIDKNQKCGVRGDDVAGTYGCFCIFFGDPDLDKNQPEKMVNALVPQM